MDSGVKLMPRCSAEMHAHIEGECLGLLARCVRDEGHRPQDWHKSADASGRAEWNYDHSGCEDQEIKI